MAEMHRDYTAATLFLDCMVGTALTTVGESWHNAAAQGASFCELPWGGLLATVSDAQECYYHHAKTAKQRHRENEDEQVV